MCCCCMAPGASRALAPHRSAAGAPRVMLRGRATGVARGRAGGGRSGDLRQVQAHLDLSPGAGAPALHAGVPLPGARVVRAAGRSACGNSCGFAQTERKKQPVLTPLRPKLDRSEIMRALKARIWTNFHFHVADLGGEADSEAPRDLPRSAAWPRSAREKRMMLNKNEPFAPKFGRISCQSNSGPGMDGPFFTTGDGDPHWRR